jgi:uncharacterized membrane protein
MKTALISFRSLNKHHKLLHCWIIIVMTIVNFIFYFFFVLFKAEKLLPISPLNLIILLSHTLLTIFFWEYLQIGQKSIGRLKMTEIWRFIITCGSLVSTKYQADCRLTLKFWPFWQGNLIKTHCIITTHALRKKNCLIYREPITVYKLYKKNKCKDNVFPLATCF